MGDVPEARRMTRTHRSTALFISDYVSPPLSKSTAAGGSASHESSHRKIVGKEGIRRSLRRGSSRLLTLFGIRPFTSLCSIILLDALSRIGKLTTLLSFVSLLRL